MAEKIPAGEEMKSKLLHEWHFMPLCPDCKTTGDMWFQVWWRDDDGFGLRFSYSKKPVSDDWSEMARYGVGLEEFIEIPNGATHVVLESDGGVRRSGWTGLRPQIAFKGAGETDGREEV